MLSLVDELESLVQGLESAGIENAVCGGLSLAIHGYPRATLDIKLLTPETYVEEAIEVGIGCGFDIVGDDLSFKDGKVEIRRISKIDSVGEILSLDFVIVTPILTNVWEERE